MACILESIMISVFWYLLVPITLTRLCVRVVSWLVDSRAGACKRKTRGKTMIILGSGGHTKEILNLTKVLPMSFEPRLYVCTDSDTLSFDKAREFEKQRKGAKQTAEYYMVPRIRDVGQRLTNALVTRFPGAMYQTTVLMINETPEVLLCNGPGVCIMFCIIAAILNVLRVSETRIIYVESICRVKTLSLTGRILVRVVHDFFVQWKDLQVKTQAQFPNSKVLYLGRLS